MYANILYINANHSVYMKIPLHIINHPQSNDIFLIRTIILSQCDLIIQSLWLSCLVMCPAGSSYVHRQPCHRKTSDTCISLHCCGFGVFGAPVSRAQAATSAWSALSSQLVRALKPNSDKQKNLMPLGMFCWSEWIKQCKLHFLEMSTSKNDRWKSQQGQFNILSYKVDKLY